MGEYVKEGSYFTRDSKMYKRVRTPSILQMECVECGAASLAMVLAYYKKFIPLEVLRVKCNVTRDGVKAQDVAKAAMNLGFDVHGFKREPEKLKYIKPPMIIHWDFNHFVVLEGFRGNHVYINDPAEGPVKITLDELSEHFTGVVLALKPGKDFVEGGKKNNIYKSLATRAKMVKDALLYLLVVELLLVIPGFVVPAFSSVFIDEIVLNQRVDWMYPLLWLMGGTAVFQGILTYLRQKYLLSTQVKLSVGAASKFFWHVLRLPSVFFQQRSVGDINSRMGSNATISDFIAGELTTNVICLITMCFYFFVMLQYSMWISFLVLALSLVNVVILLYSAEKVKSLNNKITRDSGRIYGTTAIIIKLIETIKATSMEQGMFSKWAGEHAGCMVSRKVVNSTVELLYSVPSFISSFSSMMILFLGGLEVMKGNMTVGALTAYQTLAVSFMSPISQITQLGMSIKQLSGDMARVDDIMEYEIDKLNNDDESINKKGQEFYKLEGMVEIKNLRFGYNRFEEPLIDGFNLSVKPGSRVAIVGDSGSGKSTISKLIGGVLEPWSGEILFDGHEIKDISKDVFRSSLSVVNQDINIFGSSVLSNISMWDESLPEDQCINAAKDACIHDEISQQEKGYQTVLSEGGMELSGGQRQRLEIARALAQNPSILIMDEATSALDTITENLVDQNIRRRGCTCIIVAHRLSTIRDCDEIIVMSKGKIVQRGTHDQMKNQDGFYANLIKTAV